MVFLECMFFGFSKYFFEGVVEQYFLAVAGGKSSGVDISFFMFLFVQYIVTHLYKGFQAQKAIICGMNRQQLEIYTRDHLHHGVNSQEVLEKFLNYQALCSEPLLVFRFMEEKAICTFLPNFWIAKARLFAEMGDYSNCFECIQLARSRVDEEQVQQMYSIEENERTFKKGMIEQMRRFPLKTKRVASQFNLQEEGSISSKKEKQGDMLKLYDEKYGALRKEKETKALQKWNKLPKPWQFELYEEEDQKQKKIEQQIHEHSVRISKDVKYHSMHTPIKARDPQRLTKTMDSVEILKKKRSTKEKSRRHKKFPENHADQEDDEMNSESCSRMMVSLPVGRKFASVKRRVTFKSEASLQLENLRSQEQHPHSFGKVELGSSKQNSEQKMQEEGNSFSHIINENSQN